MEQLEKKRRAERMKKRKEKEMMKKQTQHHSETFKLSQIFIENNLNFVN